MAAFPDVSMQGSRALITALGVHGALDRRKQRLQCIRIIVADPIDEESRRAVHATVYTAQEIFAHAMAIHVLRHLAYERLLLKIEGESIVD